MCETGVPSVATTDDVSRAAGGAVITIGAPAMRRPDGPQRGGRPVEGRIVNQTEDLLVAALLAEPVPDQERNRGCSDSLEAWRARQNQIDPNHDSRDGNDHLHDERTGLVVGSESTPRHTTAHR